MIYQFEVKHTLKKLKMLFEQEKKLEIIEQICYNDKRMRGKV